MSLLDEPIFPEKEADLGSYIEEQCLIASFERLKPALVEAKGSVLVKLKFSKTLADIPILTGEIKTIFPLQCQRCLGTVDYAIDIKVNLAFITLEAHEKSLPEVFESLLLSEEKSFILSELIEEELLLALPLIAKHSHLEDCNSDVVAYLHQQDKQNPFAVLKNLKKD